MEIRVDSLKERPRRLTFEEPVDRFPALAEMAGQRVVEFRGGIGAQLIAMPVDALVEVEGVLTCSIVVACSRCLHPVEQHLELPVALSFSREAATAVGADEERELTAEDVGLIVFEGDIIDLRAPLEQEVLMALPQHPLCRSDCAGLCPSCGSDRNRNGCACSPPIFHAGLAALKGLKITEG